MLFISISLCYAVRLPALAIGTLSTFTLEWIFSAPAFLSNLRRPYPAGRRVFVATATVLFGVNSLEHDVPLKVILPHQYCCFYLGDRPPVTDIPAADLPNCSPCVYNTRKSAESRVKYTGIGVAGLQHV